MVPKKNKTEERQKCSIAISALHLERSRIFIPYGAVDGAEDVRLQLLKLNVDHIIWPSYLCALKKTTEMLCQVLYSQIWGNLKDVGVWQGRSRA